VKKRLINIKLTPLDGLKGGGKEMDKKKISEIGLRITKTTSEISMLEDPKIPIFQKVNVLRRVKKELEDIRCELSKSSSDIEVIKIIQKLNRAIVLSSKHIQSFKKALHIKQ